MRKLNFSKVPKKELVLGTLMDHVQRCVSVDELIKFFGPNWDKARARLQSVIYLLRKEGNNIVAIRENNVAVRYELVDRNVRSGNLPLRTMSKPTIWRPAEAVSALPVTTIKRDGYTLTIEGNVTITAEGDTFTLGSI